jgi:hypothetical protein
MDLRILALGFEFSVGPYKNADSQCQLLDSHF